MTWGAPRLGDASFAQLFKEQKIKLARMVNRQRWFGDGLGMVGDGWDLQIFMWKLFESPGGQI